MLAALIFLRVGLENNLYHKKFVSVLILCRYFFLEVSLGAFNLL
jgi:hypothetical protein